jgi:hypothetical protein
VVTVGVKKAPASYRELRMPHSADYSITISPNFHNRPFVLPGMDPPKLSRGESIQEDLAPAFAVPTRGDEKGMGIEVRQALDEQQLPERVACVEDACMWLSDTLNVVTAEHQRLARLEDQLKVVTAEHQRLARLEDQLEELRIKQQRLALLEDQLKEMRVEHERRLDELRQHGRDGKLAEDKAASVSADGNLEVGDETHRRRPSLFASSVMAFEERTDEIDEHELAHSMWDACLFLGCKDEANLNGESMQVGRAVTIFGVLALLINGLIQSAIVAVVVIKMAHNADIDESIAADMRCTHLSSNPRPPLATVRTCVQGVPHERRPRPR